MSQRSAGRLKIPAILLFLALWACRASAQYVTLPDTGFVNWLNNNGYGNCLNGMQLDTTCSAVLNQTYLDISYVKIDSLTGIQYFKNLDSLRCNVDTSLKYIPAIPKHVLLFECRNNLLSTLPALPDSLISFSCESNNLTSLPVLPSTLQFLACYNNRLDSLPVLPAGLQQLYCSGNLMDSLPSLLPVTLTTLWCYGNKLTKLPNLPAALTSLLCSQNQLTSLPALPSNLRQLDCYSNSLNSLPALPDSLNSLECQHNNIASLPALPSALTTLNCEYNQLSSLPALPDSMFQLYIDNNPQLACLPIFYTVEFLEFFNDPRLTCVPTYGNVVNSDPALSSLPLCDSSNTTNCTILGISALDSPRIEIYPNPAGNEVFIEASNNALGGAIGLFDLSGRLIANARINTGLSVINTSTIDAGMYIVTISSPNNQLISNKLVITH